MSAEKFVFPKNENRKLFDVKFLIENEEVIDWEQLSALKERTFSVPEIKMFGKRISWIMYIFNHDMSQEEINAAEKYFTEPNVFKVLSQKNLSEDFILRNKEKVHWLSVLKNSNLSGDFIFDNLESWNEYNTEDVKKAIMGNPHIDLDSDNFKKLVLFLKLKS